MRNHPAREVNDASGAVHRPSGWARRVSAELGSVLLDTLGLAATIESHEVIMIVRDDGVGLGNEAPAARVGSIAAIRARSQAYKGHCEVAGARNAGTTVTVSLPIPQLP